jgi:hypothetical protein
MTQADTDDTNDYGGDTHETWTVPMRETTDDGDDNDDVGAENDNVEADDADGRR